MMLAAAQSESCLAALLIARCLLFGSTAPMARAEEGWEHSGKLVDGHLTDQQHMTNWRIPELECAKQRTKWRTAKNSAPWQLTALPTGAV
jgi:hypothetical protein